MLYHFQIGFPRSLSTDFGILPLEYSHHARRAANDDRYAATIELPTRIDTSKARAIEVEVTGRLVTKVLYRLAYDATHDICIVVIPQRGFVKTLWLNRRDDRHATLDASKYARPVAA